jgi:hypothetical protein
MDVGDHFRAGIAQRRPFLPGALEKAQIFRTVHPRARPLAEQGRLNQLVGSGGKPPKQPVGPLRLFGGAFDDTAHQEELRIVAAMPFGVDRFQLYFLRGMVEDIGNRSTSLSPQSRCRTAPCGPIRQSPSHGPRSFF